jgi:hypothetical protein
MKRRLYRCRAIACAHGFFGPTGDGILPFFTEVEPGLFAVGVRWNVAQMLEWLAKA